MWYTCSKFREEGCLVSERKEKPASNEARRCGLVAAHAPSSDGARPEYTGKMMSILYCIAAGWAGFHEGGARALPDAGLLSPVARAYGAFAMRREGPLRGSSVRRALASDGVRCLREEGRYLG